MNIFQIGNGIYAYGAPGQRAKHSVQKHDDGTWRGRRGVKPLIGHNAVEGKAPAGAIEALSKLC